MPESINNKLFIAIFAKKKITVMDLENIYKLQEKAFDDYAAGNEKAIIAGTWMDTSTVGYWQYKHLMDVHLKPLIDSNSSSKWLTVGDGRYGQDANYILGLGVECHSSDISDVLLKEGQEKGIIKSYSKENAENLSFKDNQFDFAVCKEAYHHFPRPAIAVYEMLRVVNEAIIFLEPYDVFVEQTTLQKLFIWVKSLIGKKQVKDSFETSGNYVFSTSRREFEKMALGINLKCVAFKGYSEYYFPGMENIKQTDKAGFNKLKGKLRLLNNMAKLGLKPHLGLCSIIFKKMPTQDCISSLKRSGFDVITLPVNPYI